MTAYIGNFAVNYSNCGRHESTTLHISQYFAPLCIQLRRGRQPIATSCKQQDLREDLLWNKANQNRRQNAMPKFARQLSQPRRSFSQWSGRECKIQPFRACSNSLMCSSFQVLMTFLRKSSLTQLFIRGDAACLAPKSEGPSCSTEMLSCWTSALCDVS